MGIIEKSKQPFRINSDYKPSGDQPRAISELVKSIQLGNKHTTLMGVTGSGKTFTLANAISQLSKPVLVLAHNKTLAAQLCAEFTELFPDNAVEYFVSYYDYYQPEAYIPKRDTYIEKEADINQEIERLRHRATRSLFIRQDVIIVSSVSCIYGLGMPEDYVKGVIQFKKNMDINRLALLSLLNGIHYERNDFELMQGKFRVKGDTIDIFPKWEDLILRLSFFGDTLEEITIIDPLNQDIIQTLNSFELFPATHYVVQGNQDTAIHLIRNELNLQYDFLVNDGRLLEANRLKSRTNYDIDIINEIGYCKGIENYSRHLSGRAAGEPPGVLLDFFSKDFVTIIDESHVTIPQIRGMYNGDQSRKQSLVDYGFRLPSAKDNRPLTFDEFIERTAQIIYVSATPGTFELTQCQQNKNPVIEQIIRPTGLIDPEIVIKPSSGQLTHLKTEIEKRIAKNERVLITTLTKKFSEDLSHYFEKNNIKSIYLHSDIKALDRIDILHELRVGTYDVLIGVNLLREGLDLPEVSLVAILDADKEGFLRNERSLIQTMGRAARNQNGTVILYADKQTDSMKKAVLETQRRRKIQQAYNETHGIKPKTVVKKISDIRQESRNAAAKSIEKVSQNMSASQLPKLIQTLEKDMKNASDNLEFELAAVLRDQIETLKNMPFINATDQLS